MKSSNTSHTRNTFKTYYFENEKTDNNRVFKKTSRCKRQI